MGVPPLVLDERLKEWATERQGQFIDGVIEMGSLAAACRKYGWDGANVSKAISAVKRRAAMAGHSPQHDMTQVAPEPYVVKGTSTLYDAEGKPKLQWVKTSLDRALAEQQLRDAMEALSEEVPRLAPLPSPTHTLDHLCNVFTLTDSHVGMLAWRMEGGADWDLAIAERTLIGCFEQLVSGAQRPA